VTFSQAQIDSGFVPAITGSAAGDAVVITSPSFSGGLFHIDASTLVLNSWTDNSDILLLSDNVNNASTSFVGSSHPDQIHGNDGADFLNGEGGRDALIGGAGADTFIFDAVALTDAHSGIFDVVSDYDRGLGGAYDFGEGDQIDLSALLSTAYNHGSGQAVSALLRLVDDHGGALDLQIDTDGTANGVSWTTMAELDGLRPGDHVSVILDSSLPPVSIVRTDVTSAHDFNKDGLSDIVWRNGVDAAPRSGP
jgi:Ca2+-binding RTX toxin-like protein